MLLQKLCEYSDRLDLPPPMYDKMAIKWLIDLDGEGRFLAFVQTEGGGKRSDRGKEYLAPHIGKTSGVKARLLAENGEYVLGLARDSSQRSKVAQRHKAFVNQVKACGASTGHASILAIVQFLESFNLTNLPIPNDLRPSDNLTFRVDGVLPIHLKIVQDYWAFVATAEETSKTEPAVEPMACLICGRLRPPVKRHQFKIKRVPGGQSSGMALISANVPAFESYGLEASLIAPTCRECGERFTKAANTLIDGEDTHITVGPLVYIFWSRQKTPFSVATLLSKAEPDEVRALLNSAFTGKHSVRNIEPASFYATAFSASGGRVVVRDWLETTVERARENLARWFALQAIVGEWGERDAPFYPIQGYLGRDSKRWIDGLAECVLPLVRQRRDIQDVNPNVPRALIRMALGGGPLPNWLLAKAVTRNVSEQGVTRSRAALIKMVLLSSKSDFTVEDFMLKLDSENDDPAYLCGRLLAVLEAIQREAVPGVKATITDRFFGTASSAPASVFARLIKGSQPHLAKLRKERRAVSEALQRRLEEIIHDGRLHTFPRVLTLEQQGVFALGYYHQRAEDRGAALAKRQPLQ